MSYVVVGESESGNELVQLYQSADRRAARAAATGIRNMGYAVRVLPSHRLKDLVMQPNPRPVRRK